MTPQQELHDRATRGQPLTDTEKAQLAAWYAQQDEVENNLINSVKMPQTTEVLQAQIKAALGQVAVMTQRIQDLMRQNEELRREIANLKQQVTRQLTVPAL
ncbi:MAG: hypothetical protein DYG89_49555 [Caldilinea sp. CFX5]|nr:hypothetical protein [Caldilinea sp. CFX5]